MNDIAVDDQWTDEDYQDIFYGGELIEAPPTDLEQANNVMAKIMLTQKRVNAVDATAKALKAKVDTWAAGQKKEDEGYISQLMVLIIPWARLEIQDRKKRHVELIDGVVGFRRAQGKTVDSDKDETIDWYMKNWPDYVEETKVYKLKTAMAKELFREKGEKAPTIEFEEPRDVPYVKENV